MVKGRAKVAGPNIGMYVLSSLLGTDCLALRQSKGVSSDATPSSSSRAGLSSSIRFEQIVSWRPKEAQEGTGSPHRGPYNWLLERNWEKHSS